MYWVHLTEVLILRQVQTGHFESRLHAAKEKDGEGEGAADSLVKSALQGLGEIEPGHRVITFDKCSTYLYIHVALAVIYELGIV